MSRTEAALDIFVLADLVPGAALPLRRADKDDLDGLLSAAHPTLRLGAHDAAVTFETWKDLRADSVAARLPECAALLALRNGLQEAAGGQRTLDSLAPLLDPSFVPKVLADAVRGGGPGTPPPAPPPRDEPALPTDDPLARLFDLVETKPSATTTASNALDNLVLGILGKSAAAGKNPSCREILPAVDATLGERLRAALIDPRFRALESAWLGLRFLVRRLDFRAGVRLHVAGAPRADLVQSMRGILERAGDARAEGRTALVVIDHDLELEDAALAGQLTSLAEEHALPCLAGASPRLAGAESGAGLDTVPDPEGWSNGEAMATWRQLRSLDAARWVCLSLNRFLLRAPYGRQGEAVKAFPFEEGPEGGAWGRPNWILAERIAGSFVRTGWGVEAVGAGEGGTAPDLPLRTLERKTGEEIQVPLEALLSEPRLLELSRAGFTALACRRNVDQAFTATAPTFYAPKKAGDPAAFQIDARRATLSYQLMVAEVTALMQQVTAAVDWHAPVSEIAKTMSAGFQILTLTPAGPLFQVRIEAAEEESGRITLVLTPRLDPVRALPDFPLTLTAPGRERRPERN